MNTLSIKDLRDFLMLYHRETSADEADSFILTSKQCPGFEIILENDEDINDKKVWNIIIESIESGGRVTYFPGDYDLLTHEVSKFKDWKFAKEKGDLLENLILKVQWQIFSDFSNAMELIRTNRKDV